MRQTIRVHRFPLYFINLKSAVIERSLKVAGGSLANETATREALLQRANAVLEGVQAGWLRLRIEQVLPLEKASEAHRLLESRATIGKLLLTTAS